MVKRHIIYVQVLCQDAQHGASAVLEVLLCQHGKPKGCGMLKFESAR